MSLIAKQLSRFTAQEINTIFKQARRIVKQPGFVILAAPAPKAFGRILVITSKKVGTAPERNRIRRRLKAIFYEQKLFAYNFDIIVIIKKEATALAFQELQTLLVNALQKATAKNL